MFEKLFKKTAQKAENAIDKAEKDVDVVITDAKKLVTDSRDKLALVSTLAIVGIVVGITADVISIAVGTKTLRLLKKNER